VSGYVPYEERVRRAAREEAGAAAGAAADHEAQLSRVTTELDRLKGRGTEAYLEILRPAKGVARMLNKKAVITKRGLRGGPDFLIHEVLEAYRIPGAIINTIDRHTRDQVFAAMVTPGGRVWRFSGDGVTENTWQLLASSEERVSGLAASDLARIADHLGRLHP
jgi:hypothetical protein